MDGRRGIVCHLHKGGFKPLKFRI